MVRRWAPALLAALICQLLLLLSLPQPGSDGRRARRAVLEQDTATLLRWSRTASSLATIPLQGLAGLPPPPPSSLPAGAFAGDFQSEQSLRKPVAAASQPPTTSNSGGLPRQPSEAFRLARQVAMGGRPRDAGAALVALQRRQWWLLPGQERALIALWDRSKEHELPASLGSLPEDISLRLSSPSAAAPLALAELHGRSLIDGDRLWLFWQQGESLLLLRGSLLGPPPPPPSQSPSPPPALTGS
jgi:hypothetical protein